MATLEEIYRGVMADEEERRAFEEAAKTKEGLARFLAERGCDAGVDEAAPDLASRQGELSDDELEGVAGGCGDEPIWRIPCPQCGSTSSSCEAQWIREYNGHKMVVLRCSQGHTFYYDTTAGEYGLPA